MLHSMTGYANGSADVGARHVFLELRAVNHRYLDIQFKMPEEIRHLESSLRELISSQVLRGKVECRIQLQNNEQKQAVQLEVNKRLVARLADLNQKIRKQHPDLGKLTVADILQFPGVIERPNEEGEELEQVVQDLLREALQSFNHSREREGEKLGEHLLHRLQLMDDIVEILSQLFPQLLQQHTERIEQRLRDAVAHIDGDRLKQEFALFMQKADVDEEFSRLRTHIGEVRRIVTQGKGSVGKRLDFLMQELNREANTLGSKSIATECTQASVELKVLIEQMREQVQNIE